MDAKEFIGFAKTVNRLLREANGQTAEIMPRLKHLGELNAAASRTLDEVASEVVTAPDLTRVIGDIRTAAEAGSLAVGNVLVQIDTLRKLAVASVKARAGGTKGADVDPVFVAFELASATIATWSVVERYLITLESYTGVNAGVPSKLIRLGSELASIGAGVAADALLAPITLLQKSLQAVDRVTHEAEYIREKRKAGAKDFLINMHFKAALESTSEACDYASQISRSAIAHVRRIQSDPS